MTSDPSLKIVELLERQNRLLEIQTQILNSIANLTEHQIITSRQSDGKKAWQDSNKELSKKASEALPILGKLQSTYLSNVLDEISQDEDFLSEAEPFVMQEFLDRHGQKLAHLQVLIQLVSFMGQ